MRGINSLPLAAMLLLLVTIAGLSKPVAGRGHDLRLGYRQNGDRLLEQKMVERHYLPLLKVEETVTIKGDGNSRITYIEAVDVKGSDYSVPPVIRRGGPGETFVTLHFESERGHGIHYLVKVYGI